MKNFWSIKQLHLPLRVNWSIARGAAKEKTILIVTYESDNYTGMGEVAFLTNSGPNYKDIKIEFERILSSINIEINGLENMSKILNSLKISPNLRCALECAYINCMAAMMESNTSTVLGVPSINKVVTSHSIPIMQREEMKDYFIKNDLNRFSSIKIKIGDSEDYEKVLFLSEIYTGKIRIDGNECFHNVNEVMDFCKKIEKVDIEFFEQPLKRNNFSEGKKLKKVCPYLLMADESIQDGPVVSEIVDCFQGINVKISKSGGLFKALKQIRDAKELELKVMMGCMVESTLGISCALAIGHNIDFFDLDGFLLLEKDPFNLLYEDKGYIYFNYTH